ncbi:MAG: hypothetical protein E7Z62_02970 [Thermoplasmata archaeon]|nr:hypothetical protein [Thermoplasmata archaeon]MBE6523898.1 hypothetical protein [Thermoplasmata archaeon]
MALFKTKEERASIKFDKASDLIAQKQYGDALNNLNKVISLGQATPEVNVLKRMLEMRTNYRDPNELSKSIGVFSNYPGLMVKYGVYDVSVDALLNECNLRIKGQQALNNSDVSQEAGLQLISTAAEFAAYDRTFILEEIFDEKKVTARDYSNMMYALGYERLSEAIKWEDPKKAAEFQQQALIYNNERHNQEAISKNQEFIRGASMTVHCWFCGREVSGENIHFVPMSSMLTDPILRQADPNKPLATNSTKSIFACRACYSAIDTVGKTYFELGKKYTDAEVTKAYNQLMSEINDLQRQINGLRAGMH